LAEWVRVTVGDKIFTILIVDGKLILIGSAAEKRLIEDVPFIGQNVANIRPFSFSDFLHFAKSHPILVKKDWETYFGEILH